MKSIDEIFRNGQTQKRIPVNDALWNRLETRLDDKLKLHRLKMNWTIAASIIVIMFCSIYIVQFKNNIYQVEDLINERHPTLSTKTWKTDGKKVPP